MRHVMLDLETLGLRPGCAIVSIGAVEFDDAATPSIGRSYYAVVDKPEGTVDVGTIKWWLRQGDEARAALSPTEDDLAALRREYPGCTAEVVGHAGALDGLNRFFVECGARYLWCHAAFDEPIVRCAPGQAGVPWSHKDVRDLRTLSMLAGVAVGLVPPSRVDHHALADATWQANLALTCLGQLSLRVTAKVGSGDAAKKEKKR